MQWPNWEQMIFLVYWGIHYALMVEGYSTILAASSTVQMHRKWATVERILQFLHARHLLDYHSPQVHFRSSQTHIFVGIYHGAHYLPPSERARGSRINFHTLIGA